MLTTFKCDAYADITLFGDVAQRLGQILAEDARVAFDRLNRQLEEKKPTPAATPESADNVQGEERDDQAVRFEYRALPLIELLTAAAKKNCNVMWE